MRRYTGFSRNPVPSRPDSTLRNSSSALATSGGFVPRSTCTARLMCTFGWSCSPNSSRSSNSSGRSNLRRFHRSLEPRLTGVAVSSSSPKEFAANNSPRWCVFVLGFRMACASSTMTRSKLGGRSESASKTSSWRSWPNVETAVIAEASPRSW